MRLLHDGRINGAVLNACQRFVRFIETDNLPTQERSLLWNTLAGLQKRLAFLENENHALRRQLASRRHRLADRAHSWLRRLRSMFWL